MGEHESALDAHASQGFSTRAIHAGYSPDPLTGAVNVPIYASSTFAQDGVGGLRGGYAVTVVADAHTCKDRPHVSGEALVAHLNWLWGNMDVPGNMIRVLPLDELAADAG